MFIGLDSLTKFDVKLFLSKTQKILLQLQLGAIPGCGGAIIVVQYIQGRTIWILLRLTATMGDAFFNFSNGAFNRFINI